MEISIMLNNTKLMLLLDSSDSELDYKNIIDEYKVVSTNSGLEGLAKVEGFRPNLILLNMRTADISGFEFCEKIKKNPLTHDIPIIVVTDSTSQDDELRMLEIGADDFVRKPIDSEVLKMRIKMVLRRLNTARSLNPLTGLPGNIAIEQTTDKLIVASDPFAVLYVDLNNFKAFNDKYGYENGDKLIKLTARIIMDSIRTSAGEGDFVGHIGGDDYIILLTSHDRIKTVAEYIISNFDQLIPFQYSLEDQQKGYMETVNRQGDMQKFPIMSVSIAVVTNRTRPIESTAEVSDIASELKHYAKQFNHSVYVVDRRHGSEKFEDGNEEPEEGNEKS
jgi:diguanylate cyclase (GGDEF)-like protein